VPDACRDAFTCVSTSVSSLAWKWLSSVETAVPVRAEVDAGHAFGTARRISPATGKLTGVDAVLVVSEAQSRGWARRQGRTDPRRLYSGDGANTIRPEVSSKVAYRKPRMRPRRSATRVT
jgi:hypothetical protein